MSEIEKTEDVKMSDPFIELVVAYAEMVIKFRKMEPAHHEDVSVYDIKEALAVMSKEEFNKYYQGPEYHLTVVHGDAKKNPLIEAAENAVALNEEV